jgi:hypothetical protein
LRKKNAKKLEDLSPKHFSLADHAIRYMIHIRTPVCLNNSTSFSFHLTAAVTSGVIKRMKENSHLRLDIYYPWLRTELKRNLSVKLEECFKQTNDTGKIYFRIFFSAHVSSRNKGRRRNALLVGKGVQCFEHHSLV